jgi:peptide/nickel transport system permease protein
VTTVDVVEPVTIGDPDAIPGRGRALRRFLHNRLAVAGAVFLVVLLLVAVFAPVFAPHDPNDQNLLLRYQRPGDGYLLGTDDFGRDQLSRLIFGARSSLLFSLIAISFSAALGIPFGLAAGFIGGRVDGAISRLNDMMLSVPGLFLAIVVAGVLGKTLVNGALAIGLISAPRFFRVVRAVTADVRGETYIEASRALGATTPRILATNVLPNTLGPLVVSLAIGLGTAVVAEASLSFIGLGIQPPTASWGNMLQTASANITQAPHLVYPPGIMVGLTVLAYQLLGDGLRSAFGTTRSAVSEGSGR